MFLQTSTLSILLIFQLCSNFALIYWKLKLSAVRSSEFFTLLLVYVCDSLFVKWGTTKKHINTEVQRRIQAFSSGGLGAAPRNISGPTPVKLLPMLGNALFEHFITFLHKSLGPYFRTVGGVDPLSPFWIRHCRSCIHTKNHMVSENKFDFANDVTIMTMSARRPKS